MLINTYLDTEDFVHLYYAEDEPPASQGCGAGARLASKYPRPPSPEFQQVAATSSNMSERERHRTPPQPEPPPHRVRASDLYPRLRTHYDEPGLDAGFSPICGEFIQWVGRTADGGTIAMSNYRLHLQPRRRSGPGASVPLRLIDALEIRDLLCLIIFCKHGRQLKCTFNTSDQCIEWWRRLNMGLAPIGSLQETFAAAYAAWAKEQPPTSVHRALMRASHAPQPSWFGPELERLGFTSKGAWRVTAVNSEYKLCPSYPPLLIVPASICDEDLDSVARFRAMRRIPAVVWRHRGSGAVIARSSQPEVGWFGWRSSEDERLLAAFVSACNHDRPTPNKQLKLLIVDARSYASAVTNRARGGGCECAQYYPAADIQFMSLPNIHHVRKSFQQMRDLAAEPPEQPNWHSNLERTLWPQYVCGVARAAAAVARAAHAGRPVLVHCSDGWDRTPQLVAAAQLILDPFYRTLQGFRILIEREWLDFGHKFADRCGHQFGAEDPNERSPIFLQWLHVVYQMMVQYPWSFEFNEAYLIKLATHVHSCMFGTFLCNTSRERAECRAADTAQVWHLLQAPAYRNHLYSPHLQHDQVIWPECSVRTMQVWWGLTRGEREREPPAREPAPPPPPPAPEPHHNGLMTKTRSCDNLLTEGEKRTTQRRCSDPSLAPDVMKLSLGVNRSSSAERGRAAACARAALTDSGVDQLRADTDTDTDQVDGLHPDHFENRMRDITSNSSSLEREIVAAPSASLEENKPEMSAVAMATNHVIVNGEADIADSVRVTSEVGTPEEPPVFVCETYTDVIGMADAARESARTRNISITWRSISESSNQSSTGFDIPENSPQSRLEPATLRLQDVPVDNHNSTEGDVVNHNVVNELTNHNREVEQVSNGAVNGLGDIATKFLEVDLNGGASSSGASSESEGEGAGGCSTRVASQLTLCPASPRRAPARAARACPHCTCACADASASVSASGSATEPSPSSSSCWCGACGEGGAGAEGGEGASRVRCVCGAGARTHSDSLDGLPPAADPLQARLHQIILYQKKVVEDLRGQLREAREALRRASPAPAAPPPAHALAAGNSNGNGGARRSARSGSSSGAASGSSSGSASEVEVGEEARGVLWLPDSAAPRCQHCRNQFWLARRRHHCRRCGGIFCGSCSEMSPWGDMGAVRVCRRCRALR